MNMADKIENILSCLIDNLEEGIHVVDSNGKTIYYNNAMEKMEGLTSQDVMGKRITDYYKGFEEDSSTLLNAIKNKKKYTDVIQHYSSRIGKNITTINTTIPVIQEDRSLAAIEISKDMTRLKELNEKICKLQNEKSYTNRYYAFSDIIGISECMKKAMDIGIKASISNSSVLIYGETGCGKELFAQSIYSTGNRKDKPFIPINCAAIPDALLEGMLFGTVKGSFTGAENKKGLFEEADGGTILLDEINSMEPYLQSKLLRVLQDGYIRPLGSNKIIDVNVRIIATLNEEPKKLIENGKLRKDFYYRLSVIRINVPPLRERKEDIPLLCDYFIKYYNLLLGRGITKIDDEIMEYFMEYDWPGNVRELKNVIEAAINMADGSNILYKKYFDNAILKKELRGTVSEFLPGDMSLDEYLMNIEKNILLSALKNSEWNISKASRLLKMTRQNLQYKIKKYGMIEEI